MDAKKGVSKFSKEFIREIFTLSDTCNSFDVGDDVNTFKGSILNELTQLFDISKKVEPDWDEIKVEKLDFTDAQHEKVEPTLSEITKSGTKKRKSQ